ncbi:MAG: hypothetical protein PHS41_11185 [Victivallaceae bacterium]|nr:hypothetical protein [Victivallaceae bacterium]
MKWIWLVFLCSTLTAEPVNLWSGRSQNLPGTGKWVLAAEHGRVLGSGEGEARVDIPALADGATLDAFLTRNGKPQKVRFHSPRPLTGVSIPEVDNNRTAQKLSALGAQTENKGKIGFRFPDKCDFPLNLGADFEVITMLRAKNPGQLSVLYDKKEQFLDINGDFTCAILRKGLKITIVFTPEFDLDNIENVLLVKQRLKENEK